jgi:hypothetical protein
MDTPTDVATLLGELDVGNDKAVAELVVLLYSELHSLASRYLRRERGDHTLQTTAHRGGIRGCWLVCDAMSDTLRLLLHSRLRVLSANAWFRQLPTCARSDAASYFYV